MRQSREPSFTSVIWKMSMVAVGVGFAAGAFAQETAPGSAAGPEAGISEVVVSGSRLVTNGADAPTPVTVVSTEQLQLAAPRSLVDGVLELPQLRGSVSVQNQANGTTASNGADYLNLRGLGTSRTLVLMDGRRLTPNQNTSAVDAAMIPEALVSRVDIVTGGASAAYGSDAVAGVINFVLNNKFVGLKADVQGGISNYGDNKNSKVDVTWGDVFADGRLHVVASLLDYYSAGVPKYADRPWTDRATVAITNPNVTATNPASPTNPKQIVVTNGFSSIAANGGLITNTALRGTTFDPDGSARPFQYGSLVSSSQMEGGDPGTFNPNLLLVLQPEQHRDQFYTHVTLDVNDNLSVYTQLLGSRNRISFNSIPTFEVSATSFTIFRDNAYLPDSVRSLMAGGDINSFTMGRLSDDIATPSVDGVTDTYMATLGFDGKIPGSDWQYHGYGQIGRSKAQYDTLHDPISDNLYRAADAVRDPATGGVVCRSTLTNPNDGCVPVDLFGYGAPSQAAISYILGTAHQVYHYDQNVVDLSSSGSLLSLPAGNLSLAAGAAWRQEKLRQTADAISQEIRTGQGIQGYPVGLVNTLGGFERTNPQPASGEYDVKEFFVEIEAPLLKNLPLAHSLSLNGAVRYVDYSTSGGVTPWKGGAVWEPVDWLRFRGTRSRDIRAPNLGELYRGSSQGTANVVDPFNNNANVAVLTGSVGNPNLKPEIADGTTVGMVVTPSVLPSFNFSLDYYSIRINEAIATLSAQQELSNCYEGVQEQCSFILRAADGSLARILQPSFNTAFTKTSGADLEMSYATPIPSIGGRLSTRLIVNYLNELTTGIADAIPIDAAGDMSQAFPKWMGTLQANLSLGKPGIFLQERVVGSGKYTGVDISGTPVTSSSIDRNSSPTVFYTDLTLTYDVSDKISTFLSVNNLFDKDPPMIPSYLTAGSGFGNSPVGGVRGLYDFIGRMYTLGVHVRL